jgi:hypothetical protein
MTKKLNIDIIARDKSKQALNGVQNNLQKTKTSVLNLKNALIGLGVGAVLKSFVDVGKEVENLQVRFKFLFGSVQEGQTAFDNLSKFASRVPFSLEEITAASGNLAVVSKDANDLTRILEITGNVAAVTGLDFATAGSQIQRAFSGGIAAADIFREKGVRQLLGFKEGAKVSIDETVKAFEEAFSGDGKFANATDDLARTLTGTVSMLQDKFFNFQKLVSEQFIGTLTEELGDLNNFLQSNEEQLEEIATALGQTLAQSAIVAGNSIIILKDAFEELLEIQIKVNDILNKFNTNIFNLLTGTSGLRALGDELEEDDTSLKKVSVSTQHLSHNFKEATKSVEENNVALTKNQQLAKDLEEFQIRNNKIFETINHAELERMRKLDEAVERNFRRQEAIVNEGQPYMVGEAGREMFVPQQSGTIVPNNQLTGTNVNITIMANDTEGFDELLSRRRATVVNIINDALNSQGKEAII